MFMIGYSKDRLLCIIGQLRKRNDHDLGSPHSSFRQESLVAPFIKSDPDHRPYNSGYCGMAGGKRRVLTLISKIVNSGIFRRGQRAR
jgi:hypothetical protein